MLPILRAAKCLPRTGNFDILNNPDRFSRGEATILAVQYGRGVSRNVPSAIICRRWSPQNPPRSVSRKSGSYIEIRSSPVASSFCPLRLRGSPTPFRPPPRDKCERGRSDVYARLEISFRFLAMIPLPRRSRSFSIRDLGSA